MTTTPTPPASVDGIEAAAPDKWLTDQIEIAKANVASWPEWKRNGSTLKVPE